MDIENLDMEWKESWADKYLKTIAAFYNTKGGRIIIGRKDNGEYVGVQDVKGTTKTISDTIRNKFHFISETRVGEYRWQGLHHHRRSQRGYDRRL